MLALDTNVLARYAGRPNVVHALCRRHPLGRTSVERALDNLRRGIDFADALHHASSRACDAFLTFDARRFAAKARRLAITPPVRLPT